MHSYIDHSDQRELYALSRCNLQALSLLQRAFDDVYQLEGDSSWQESTRGLIQSLCLSRRRHVCGVCCGRQCHAGLPGGQSQGGAHQRCGSLCHCCSLCCTHSVDWQGTLHPLFASVSVSGILVGRQSRLCLSSLSQPHMLAPAQEKKGCRVYMAAAQCQNQVHNSELMQLMTLVACHMQFCIQIALGHG